MAKRINSFNILTIGKRGVGKTVFVIGCYVESKSQLNLDQGFYLDFQPNQAAILENILSFIAQKKAYPPATSRNTLFNFSLKRQLWTEETLCQFKWTDMPGEFCNLHCSNSKDFHQLLLHSHACCVFLDIPSLSQNNQSQFQETIDQAMAIASVVESTGLNYPIAIVLTKGDTAQLGPISQVKIELGLQQFLSRLDSTKALYERFYSAVPICNSSHGEAYLKPEGTIAPFLWLASELRKIHNSRLQPVNLVSSLSDKRPKKANISSIVKNLEYQPLVTQSLFSLIISLFSVVGIGIAAFLILSQSTTVSQQNFSKYFNNLYSEIIGSNRSGKP